MYTSTISSRAQIRLPREVREALGVKAGDTVGFEIRGNIVSMKCVEQFDVEFHSALSSTLGEWATSADEEAFGDL